MILGDENVDHSKVPDLVTNFLYHILIGIRIASD